MNASPVHHPGKFVWYEHVSNNAAAARSFYEPLFGWHTEAMPMGEQRYTMIFSGSDGIGGFRDAPPGVPPNWLSYLSVADVDASHSRALAAGATERMAPMSMGEVGRGSVIADPTGAALAIWHGAEGDRPDVERAPDGTFCWTELWTGDDAKALAFYERVFGYSHERMDMGGQGSYVLLKTDNLPRAGLMRSTQPAAPPMWLPYVAVADTDASAAKAVGLGAKVVVPATDIPGVGRFAVLLDPLGAAIAMIRMQDRAA